jgi:hypothetical protein
MATAIRKATRGEHDRLGPVNVPPGKLGWFRHLALIKWSLLSPFSNRSRAGSRLGQPINASQIHRSMRLPKMEAPLVPRPSFLTLPIVMLIRQNCRRVAYDAMRTGPGSSSGDLD